MSSSTTAAQEAARRHVAALFAERDLRNAESARERAAERERAAQDVGQERAAAADRTYWERQIAAYRERLDQLRRGEA